MKIDLSWYNNESFLDVQGRFYRSVFCCRPCSEFSGWCNLRPERFPFCFINISFRNTILIGLRGANYVKGNLTPPLEGFSLNAKRKCVFSEEWETQKKHWEGKMRLYVRTICSQVCVCEIHFKILHQRFPKCEFSSGDDGVCCMGWCYRRI